MSDLDAVSRSTVLDEVAASFKPDEIRDLADSLLKLADSIDQNWTGPQPEHISIFRWPNHRRRIARNALELAKQAKLDSIRRQGRQKFLPKDLLGEPAWDMLLDLFQQYAGGAKVSVSSLCIASGCPQTTALRYIAALEDAGLVRRVPSQADKRVVFVELTDDRKVAMGRTLEMF